jgi:hypothetical protein
MKRMKEMKMNHGKNIKRVDGIRKRKFYLKIKKKRRVIIKKSKKMIRKK